MWPAENKMWREDALNLWDLLSGTYLWKSSLACKNKWTLPDVSSEHAIAYPTLDNITCNLRNIHEVQITQMIHCSQIRPSLKQVDVRIIEIK